ncbi:MAG: hypothetical protein IKK82_05380 [Kiritimatiellae bacterium]|nr:hypothetical protein [Kiritimatiellia bacterium]
MNSLFKKAFTLIEVNLAIFIMAGGVLAMISLYSLGFRESRQSREDVASSAMADAILNPLVVALSSRDLTWSQWKNLNLERANSGINAGDGNGSTIQVLPKDGWLAYFDTKGSGVDKTYYVSSDPASKANGVYSELLKADKTGYSLPGSVTLPQGMTYALVASRESEHSPIITLAVRCVRKNLRNTLMSQPVFSTEVRFQGDPNQ